MNRSTDSKYTIYAALGANLAIAATKLGAALFTGSSALLSEGVHSLVDSSNEILLLYGLRRSSKRRSREHPMGYGRELYFWSFIVALLVFALGAGVSIFEGLDHLRSPRPNQHPALSYFVLGVSTLFDGYSFSVALRQFRANKGDVSYLTAIFRSKDPTSFAVLLEDGAALIGIAIAFAGVLSAQLLRRPELDGVASVGIGALLALTALLMARECKALLIGESASPEMEASIRDIVAGDRAISRVHGVLTLHLAPDQIVAALSAAFKNSLTTLEIETSIERIESRIREAHPEIKLLFLKPQTSRAFSASTLVRELAESDRET
jgi:cation diffusion facilitator family transporter